MERLHKLLKGKTLQTISLGTLCAVGAFAMGIETAGDVHPFARSQAALETVMMGDGGNVKGDIDGDGVLTATDAWVMMQIAEGWESATVKQIENGDTDGDQRITDKDLGHVLFELSRQ